MSTWTVYIPEGTGIDVEADYLEMSPGGALCFRSHVSPHAYVEPDIVRAFAAGSWAEIVRHPIPAPVKP